MTNVYKVPCPVGCEELNTQADLAKRMLCSTVEAGRRTISGKLRAHSATANQVFYRTEDLNRFRGPVIEGIGRQCALMSASERDRLIALFAKISAAEGGRSEPNVDDFVKGHAGAATSLATGQNSIARQLVRRR